MGEASRLLADYENQNRDLPKTLRRQMAIFFLAPKVGKKALEELFDRKLGTTPFVHLPWYWANAFKTSGIDHLWDEFVRRRNGEQAPTTAIRWLRSQMTEAQEATLERRFGGSIPAGDSRVSTKVIWTRGGSWHRESNLTKVIVLGEKISGRDYTYNEVTRALGLEQVAQLEREVYNIVNEDHLLYHDAQLRAVEYVRRRIPEMLGYERPTTSYKTVSWFFQAPVPHPEGGYVDFRSEANYPMRMGSGGREGKDGRWFPAERKDD